MPQTMVAPHVRKNPASCTAGKTPSSSKTGILAGRSDSPIWSRGKCSRSRSSTCQPWRASMVAVVLPPGPPPITTTSAVRSALGAGAIPRLLGSGSSRLCLNRLACRRIDLEGTGQLQLFGHFPDGRNHLCAHEAQAAHGVIMGHRAISIPEENTARPDVLQDVSDLRQDRLGGARDDGVILDLSLVWAS